MSGSPTPADGDAVARARSLHEAGRHGDAEAVLAGALTGSPGSAPGFRLLASIERALRNPRREVGALLQALATAGPGEFGDAGTAGIWKRIATLRARCGDRRGSAEACERAIEILPDDADAHEGLARARFALQDLDGAARSVEALERLFPDAAFTHLFAGHLLKATGDTSAARERYEKAFAADPELGEAAYNLVDLSLPAADDELAKRIAALAARNDLAAADRINAGFAWAKVLDGAGRYEEAFDRFRRSNELARETLARRGSTYAPAAVEARVTRTIEEYPAASFRDPPAPLPIELRPVFVIGLPRSGTTLIEQILASHADVEAGGELPAAQACAHRLRQARAEAGRRGAIDPEHSADAGLLAEATERYVDALFERGLEGPWIVDKLPANFEIAGLLRLMFPRSPIVHCVRDPRATCFSLYCANFGAHEPWYHDLGDMAHFHGQYRRLMRHWSDTIPGPFVDVVYEELVRDPANEIAALLERIGLPYDSACLEFYRHPRPIMTASHAQVRRPVYTSSIDHWKRYAHWLGPLTALDNSAA